MTGAGARGINARQGDLRSVFASFASVRWKALDDKDTWVDVACPTGFKHALPAGAICAWTSEGRNRYSELPLVGRRLFP